MHSGWSARDLDCWATLRGLERVGVWVPEFVGDLWHKQNTAIWLEQHDFMQQTQNLALVCNPTIRIRDMLGSARNKHSFGVNRNRWILSSLRSSPTLAGWQKTWVPQCKCMETRIWRLHVELRLEAVAKQYFHTQSSNSGLHTFALRHPHPLPASGCGRIGVTTYN